MGAVTVGGGAPIAVQSMTNTDTADIDATVAQVRALARAGSELVRMTVNTAEAAAAVAAYPRPPARRRRHGAADRRLPLQRPQAARATIRSAPRRWPSTASTRATWAAARSATPQFAQMIEIACREGKPVRIGVNWGSLDQDLLARLMDENCAAAEPQRRAAR